MGSAELSPLFVGGGNSSPLALNVGRAGGSCEVSSAIRRQCAGCLLRSSRYADVAAGADDSAWLNLPTALQLSVVSLADLRVESPIIVKNAESKQADRQEVKQTGHPFALVKTVNAKDPQEGQQYPGNRIIDGAGDKSPVRGSIHGRNQEQVNEPADEKQSAGEKPERAGHRLAVIKTVRAREAKQPQQVADQLAVSIGSLFHAEIILPGLAGAGDEKLAARATL